MKIALLWFFFGFGLCACEADEHVERATVATFPKTRATAGVAYFVVEHNHSDHQFSALAYDVEGNLYGKLRVDLTSVMWPGQYNGYERPTRLSISLGGEEIEIIYGAELDGEQFTMTLAGTTSTQHGNPAYPARCTPGESLPLPAVASSILKGWRPLLADLSRHAGTVYGQWTGTTHMLNRSANLVAALSCLAGDAALCRAGPYRFPD